MSFLDFTILINKQPVGIDEFIRVVFFLITFASKRFNNGI